MAKVVPVDRDNMGENSQFDGNPRLRRHSRNLTKLELPHDHHKNVFFDNVANQLFPPKASKEETEEGGKVLFGQILVEEIEEELPEKVKELGPDELCKELDICSPEELSNQVWAKTGQELRRCADEFKRSKEREKVRKKAQGFNKTAISKEQFRQMLTELLLDGITKERIVVLFYFCADVAIAALKESNQSNRNTCLQYITWSLEFIVEKICTWVQKNGGWGAVYSSSINVLGKAAAIVGLGMLIFYGMKKILR